MTVKTTQAQPAKKSKLADNLTAPVAKTQNVLSADQQKKVDELVAIEIQMEPLKKTIKRQEELKKELKAIADDLFPSDETAILIGETGQIEFGPAGEKRVIEDMNGLIGKLRDKIGYEALISLLSVTLGNVDAYLSPAESAPYIGKDKGSRSLKSATKFKT